MYGAACVCWCAHGLWKQPTAGSHYAQRHATLTHSENPYGEGPARPQARESRANRFPHTVRLLSKDGVRTDLGGWRASPLCWQADSPCCSPGGWNFRPQDKPHLPVHFPSQVAALYPSNITCIFLALSPKSRAPVAVRALIAADADCASAFPASVVTLKIVKSVVTSQQSCQAGVQTWFS